MKQFRSLCGRPLISWAYDALAAAGCAPIVVVVPEEAFATARAALGRDTVLVAGGATRRDSVRHGVDLIDTERVVIHDAARPFATGEMVRRVLEALVDCDGAVTAMPVTETLKRARDGVVVDTVDRAHLYTAQTPQAFRTEMLRHAHEMALQDDFDPTDDAQLIERYGGRVAVVRGSAANIKVTYSEDFALAEALARAARGNQ